ncbi:MAG: response regulator, partial [Bacteroidales bacterium]|nr:response regulator [Bacteroidales bacterium]
KAEIAKRNTIIILILLVMVILGLTVIVLFYRYRAKQQHAKLRLEKQNMQIQQQLELAQFKEDFFTNISHEFRTPLTLIISPLEEKLAKQDGDDPQLKLMHRNAHKLLNYINQILDISKSEKGAMTVHTTKLNMVEFMEKIFHSYAPLAEKKKINFKFDNYISNHLFHSDIDKLDKIINNLLSNAFKYTPDKQTISISLNELPVINNKRRIEIIIEDTGDGISQQHLPYIFDRFYHVAKENQPASSGIGLALCKELTELMGGTILAHSTTGTGSKFAVTIPELENNNKEYTEQNNVKEIIDLKTSNKIDISEQHYDTTEINPEVFEIKEDKQHDETILIVEDNFDVRDYLLNLLKFNYHVIQAENGQIGLQQAFAYTPDLIITDVMMPVMDGNDFTEQVKSDVRTSHIPVVMLTAKADIKNKLEGIETGADDYLTKPFHPEELLVRCRNLIAQRKKLHKLFSHNHLTVDKISVNSLDKHFLDKLKSTVCEKLGDTSFDVEMLSSEMNMSRMNLYRKVKALTGTTPVEYIKTMRLQQAKQLLEQQAGNIADIATMSGFDNPSYFSKCYKQKYGVVPSEHVQV